MANTVIFEPYIGYQLGKLSIDNVEDSDSLSGLGGGLRLVYFSYGFFGGLDFHRSNLNLSGDSDDSYRQNQIGLIGGFSFPIMPVRLWMTYNPSDSIELNGGDKFTGNGIKLGLGIDPLPLVSFNIEYKNSSYDEREDLPINNKRKVSAIFFNIGLLFGTNL